MIYTAFAPAKVNLLLAITGLRPDGFHSLTSLVVPIALGDTLWLSFPKGTSGDTLDCDLPGVPADGSNLVLKAAAAFREQFPALPRAHFELEKKIPHGAGLGGGSSDAASTLILLNETMGRPLSAELLGTLASKLGSDCPLFLEGAPVIMRGRGERITRLTGAEGAALRGRRLLLFKPAFGVSTVEAYAAMKTSGGSEYITEETAEACLGAWRAAPSRTPLPLLNNMEGVVFRKHLALPVLLQLLRGQFGLAPRMSGSGSACFAFLPEGFDAAPAVAVIRECWGAETFVCETALR